MGIRQKPYLPCYTFLPDTQSLTSGSQRRFQELVQHKHLYSWRFVLTANPMASSCPQSKGRWSGTLAYFLSVSADFHTYSLGQDQSWCRWCAGDGRSFSRFAPHRWGLWCLDLQLIGVGGGGWGLACVFRWITRGTIACISGKVMDCVFKGLYRPHCSLGPRELWEWVPFSCHLNFYNCSSLLILLFTSCFTLNEC